MRKNIDAAEYKHVALGLIFIKYLSETFEAKYQELEADGDDAEDRDEYLAESIFFVPEQARWQFIQANATKTSIEYTDRNDNDRQGNIGNVLDNAMGLIEAENGDLKGVLPKVFGKDNLDKDTLSSMIDLFSNIGLGETLEKKKDLLGHVYEYFLGEFASAEGKKGGQFYTPKSIVQMMVEMIEPYEGRILDGACGSGGMFIMSEKFVQKHNGDVDDIVVYGQESNQTTYNLCRMNLAMHGMEGGNVAWNAEGSFLRDAHKDLKADFVLMNPPFNQKEWGVDQLQNDARWSLGTPPNGNANFGWMQYIIHHLNPTGGRAAVVLANGSLSSNSSGEGEIRQKMVDTDLVECVLMLPKQLFFNTGIPACVWFLHRDKPRKGETLFIDASELGYMEDRTHRAFAQEDIDKVTETYHAWQKKEESYEDVKGFCKTTKIEDIQKHKYVLTPGRYVGIPDEEDDGIPFDEKMKTYTDELRGQMDEAEQLDQKIKESLSKIGFSI
ncbi:type I restriction enzyme M protein [Flammeovirga kamogawensis]|nr:type I restriction enzyme M protein [Flammeovirga kamogawensis]